MMRLMDQLLDDGDDDEDDADIIVDELIVDYDGVNDVNWINVNLSLIDGLIVIVLIAGDDGDGDAVAVDLGDPVVDLVVDYDT